MTGYIAPVAGALLGVGAELARGLAFSTAAGVSKKATEKFDEYLYPRGVEGKVPGRPAQSGVEMPIGNMASNYLPVITPETGINRIIVNRVNPIEVNDYGAYPNMMTVGGIPQNVPSSTPLSQPFRGPENVLRDIDGILRNGIVGGGSRTNEIIREKQLAVDHARTINSVVKKKKIKSSIFVVKEKRS